jgi:hypothetical protein
MDPLTVARGRLGAVALLCAIGLAPGAWGQAAPLLKHLEGSLALAPPGEREWADARPGQTVRQGERLWTDRGSRAELLLAGHTLRASDQTQVRFDHVQPKATRISVLRGTVVARVNPLASGENFELNTPNLALRAAQAGLYRLDVDPAAGTTRVSVLEGVARLYGKRGEEWEVRAGQRVGFRGNNLAVAEAPSQPAADDVARWVQTRERGGAAAVPTQVAGAGGVKPVAAAAAIPKPTAAVAVSKAARPAMRPQARPARPPTATGRAVAARRAPVRAAQAQGDAGRPHRADPDSWDQENWLRYNHGLPPLERPAPLAIPARRIG